MTRPTLPNFLIIGAGKAGTTSLHRYLSFHPDIFMSKQKELRFFAAARQWNRGVEWYKSNFDSRYRANGEASPPYARYPIVQGVPERINQVLGYPKLIYILRDPIDRILSQYTQVADDWPKTISFHDTLPNICDSSCGYIQMSSYFFQLSRYLEIFPKESILVVINERLNSNPREVMSVIFKFLGVDDQYWSAQFETRENVGTKKKQMAEWFDRLAPESIKSLIPPEPSQLHWRLKRELYRISRIGGIPFQKPVLSASDDSYLQRLLKDDVARLREYLEDPLEEWRAYQ